MWFDNIYFGSLLTIFKIHHREIVENGVVTYDQDGKSCNVLLQTETKDYMCNWQLSDKSIFDQHLSAHYRTDASAWKQQGYDIADFFEAKFDITKFASNPRQNMYWLMNVGPKSHGIVNVSCEVEIEKVLTDTKSSINDYYVSGSQL